MTDTGGTSEFEAVRPLDDQGTPVQPEITATRRRSPWVVAGGAAAAVLLVGVVGGWLWWVNVIRGPLGAAEVVPGSADIVFTMDVLELVDGDRFTRLVEAFDPGGGFDLDELIADIDDEVENEIGLRVFEDVRAWVGRSAAVAVWTPPELFTTFDAEPDVAVAVMTRNEGRARQFIDDVIASARDDGADISTITISGVDVFSIASDTVPALVTVHSGRVLLANDPGRMAEMLDPTDPITDRSAYDRLWTAAEGDDALATVYLSEDFLEDMVSGAAQAGGFDTASAPSGAVLATARLDDDGIELTAATIALDDAVASLPGTWAADLPAGTYGYVSAALPVDGDDIADLFDEQIASFRDLGGGEDVDAFLGSFEDAFGVSLRELLSQFGDQILLAAVQSDFGPLPSLAGGPLGLGFAIGVEDEAVVRGALSALPAFLGPDGDVIVQRSDGLWAVDAGDGDLFLYGVAEGRLVLTSDQTTLDAVLGRSGGGLTDDPEWQRMAELIGEDMVMYVDLARIIATFAPPDEAADLAPLRSVGASAIVQDGVSLARVRVVIDY